MSDSSEEWLTMAQAADRLGVSPPTLRRWAEQGRIVARRTLGGHRRIPLSELPLLAPQEIPPLRPAEPEPERVPRPPRRRDELPHGRIEVFDDAGALRDERDRLAAELAATRDERDTLRQRLAEEQSALERAARDLAFLRRQLAEAGRAQSELRQVILRLVDGHPGEPGGDAPPGGSAGAPR